MALFFEYLDVIVTCECYCLDGPSICIDHCNGQNMEKAAAGLPKQGEHAEEQSMLLAQMGKVPSFSSCSTVLQNPKNSVYFGEDKKTHKLILAFEV